MNCAKSLDIRLWFKKNEVRFLFPILFAIVVSMVLVQLILLVRPFGDETLLSLQSSFNESAIWNLLIVTIIFGVFLFLLFRIRRIRNEMAAKVLIALFIEGGMLSILLFGKLVFTLLELASPIFLIFVAIVAYFGTYFAFLAFVDGLSREGRNRLFVISSGSLGAFIGILLPTLPVIGIAILLAIADTFLIQTRFFQRVVGEVEYEKMIIEMAFSTSEWGIGIGDLICYSMIVASTLANFGIIAGGFSIILIVLGALLTIKLATSHFRVPGLPISTLLGLLPSLILIVLI